GIAALAVVGGTILLLTRAPSKLVASTCRSASCPQGSARKFGVAQPPAGAPPATHKLVHRSHPTATHSTAGPSPTPHPTPTHPRTRPRPTPRATPTSTPSPTPTASPRQSVRVSYAVVSQHPHSFQGQFTIVNNGNTAITGWELVVVFPGDRIRAVWDASFHK